MFLSIKIPNDFLFGNLKIKTFYESPPTTEQLVIYFQVGIYQEDLHKTKKKNSKLKDKLEEITMIQVC